MAKEMIQCPRDTKVMYSREVCENVFRKGNIRVWCNSCEVLGREEDAVGDRPANREVLNHGESAYFCPVADPVTLAGAILELQEDRALRCRLGEEGLALYRSHFTTAAVASALQAVLSDLPL